LDKKTIIIAVVFSVIMLLWFGLVTPLITGEKPFSFGMGGASQPLPETASPTPAAPSPVPTPAQALVSAQASVAAASAVPGEKAAAEIGVPSAESTYTIRTDLVTAVLSNKGGQLVSLKMNKHLDKGQPVEMVFAGDEGSYFFGTSFGDYGTPASKDLMAAKRIDDYTVEFSRTYYSSGADGAKVPFTFRKRFTFKPKEYLFDFQVGIENSEKGVPNINNNGFAYTVFLGPQLGPKFDKLSTYDESRKYYTYANGKRASVSLKPNSVKTVKERVFWASVVGKYFSLIAVPGSAPYTVIYNSNSVPGVPTVSQLSFSRSPLTSSSVMDSIRFYIGPNQSAELSRYNDPKKNAYGDSDLKINLIVDANPLFGWLEWLLKKSMIIFHLLIPNWGIAIILVTILVKALFFPLTLKGSISMAKMAELQPKMAELQAKYKDKPDKLNQEMAEFYKREGYNPLSGCLPTLIQIPIFFAMYNLFNTHFDLRGAMFIPGWIPDLSRPDTVFDFPTVNLVIWQVSAIRILPVIYVVSQLLYGKYTQSTSTQTGQNANQMKIMLYAMPVFFFFILYNAPAGLLVYWIVSNVLTIGQQMVTNKIMHQRKLAAQAAMPVLAPKQKQKKRS
jgi:YidC/Oxa1 family membrane protein insertase